jgi:hypothetical protein
MPRKTDNQAPHASGKPRRTAIAARAGRRIVRKLAQSTLLAAGIAVTHLGVAEVDSKYKLFDRTLVDRLHEPITRHHE